MGLSEWQDKRDERIDAFANALGEFAEKDAVYQKEMAAWVKRDDASGKESDPTAAFKKAERERRDAAETVFELVEDAAGIQHEVTTSRRSTR